MSRRTREEPPFGSDSFLDVLANIVGILIILIAAAASRAGRVPTLASVSLDDKAQAPVAVTSTAAPAPAPQIPEISAPPEPEPTEPPSEITQEMQAIIARIASLEAKSLAADAKLKKVRSEYDSAWQELNAEEKSVKKRAGKLRDKNLQVARLEQALGERKQELTGLLAEFEEAKNSRPPATEDRKSV